MDKASRIKALAEKRRLKKEIPPGCRCVSEFYNGAFDQHDYVSPYTIRACNFDADVMIMAQDWASSNALNKLKNSTVEIIKQFGRNPKLRTNERLDEHLKKHFLKLEFSNTYATNLFPFIKTGDMREPILFKHMEKSAKDYAIPQIEIVNPRIVICLGMTTFNAIYAVLQKEEIKKFDWQGYEERQSQCVDSFCKYKTTEIYPVFHPGFLGEMRRTEAEINEKWMRISNRLRAIKPPSQNQPAPS